MTEQLKQAAQQETKHAPVLSDGEVRHYATCCVTTEDAIRAAEQKVLERALTTSQPAQAGEVQVCPLQGCRARILPTQPAAQPVGVPDCMVNAALSAAGFFSTAESRKDMRNALMAALNSQPAAQTTPPQQAAGEPVGEPLQGGLDNAALLNAWRSKLPGVTPTDAQMTAFALGVEVGFAHARTLERSDWSRVHDVLKKAGVHPGRTDDHLADVIAKALSTHPAPAVPDGWRITDDGDGSITIKGPGKIGCNVSDDEPYGARIFGDVLHALCRAMLAAAQAKAGAA